MSTLVDFLNIEHPAIVINTYEEDRALKLIRKYAKWRNKSFEVWRMTEQNPDPVVALKRGIDNKKNNTYYCIIDFHNMICPDIVYSTAKDVFKEAKKRGIIYIFISYNFKIPNELKKVMVSTTLSLPDKNTILKYVGKTISELKLSIPDEEVNAIVDACSGLALSEIEYAIKLSISVRETIDYKEILVMKKQIINESAILEYCESQESLETVGGLKELITWSTRKLLAYSPEAQQYGLPFPKGVLLVGVPGCGKSLTAKALASIWKVPLVKLDIGKLFNKYVGESEANTRLILNLLEAMAPAILWIDEIEKGLSGIQSSGTNDSGVTSRIFGTILTWLQENKAPIFVVATANDISKIPPEFLRKGRFDEIFFIDLPNEQEREEIFGIQLKKRNRVPENFNVSEFSKKTHNYTGAEIEYAVVDAMVAAFADNRREVNSDDIVKAISGITPLADSTMGDKITEMREKFKEGNMRSANGTEFLGTTVIDSPNNTNGFGSDFDDFDEFDEDDEF